MTAPRGERLRAFVGLHGPGIEAALRELLPPATEEPRVLHEAMHYVLFPGGKRLRPLLALAGAVASGGDARRALLPGAGIECLHTYSLVHDDLPCMDDDALRRGRPTCHTVYGDATAMLVGDALLTLAFEAVASAGAAAVRALARAAGSRGMVGGQMADLAAEGLGAARTLDQVAWIHDRKTGALITGSLVVGACAAAPDGEVPAAVLEPLMRYGDCLGRAFQIADDCLDLTASAAEMGKNPNADAAHDKLTWPAVAGLEASLAKARELADAACGMAPGIAAAARSWRGAGGPTLDGVVPLLQDLAFAAVERRS